MSTEINEVAVPTDQPLISEDLECDMVENFYPDKEIKPESKPTDTSCTSITIEIDPKEPSKEKNDKIILRAPKISNHIDSTQPPISKSQSEIQVSVTNSLSVSQTSKNSLMTFSSSGTFYDHTTSAKRKIDLRITPKRVQHSNGKDGTDFRQMEQGLLQLLENFHSGKLEAFGQDCTFERMENVREQQERLARLHFDLNSQQELCGQHTEEGIKMAKRNLAMLTENLQELSHSIEKLQSGNVVAQPDIS